MNKHPNAPAEDRQPRKKQLPITLEEYDEIHRLWELGMGKKAISVRLRRSAGTIVNAIVHLTRETVEKRMKHPMAKNDKSTYECHEMVEQDLSKFPSTVFFEHSKYYSI